MKAIQLLIACTMIFLLGCQKEDPIDPTDPVASNDELVINEFMASNENCCSDENGDFDDWVEIYNAGPREIDLGGMYVSDTPGDSDPYQIPTTDPSATTIQVGGYLVLWFDKEPDQGPLHIDLKLSKDGESIILIDKDKDTVLDQHTFNAQETDVSMGLHNGQWEKFENPTPGAPNN